MNELFKRAVAAVLMVGVTLAATMAWGVPKIGYEKIENSETVMIIDGSEVTREEFSYFLNNVFVATCQELEAQGLPASLLLNEESGGTLASYVFEQAVVREKYWHVVINEFNEHGLKLDRELLEAGAMIKRNEIEAAGGEESWRAALDEAGISEMMYDNSLAITLYMQALNDAYYGENGTKASVAEQKAYFEENFIACKHILFTMATISTGESLNDTELTAKYELAESVLERINAGEDFDALMNEYSEDQGGIKQYPDGYILTEGSSSDTEFYEAAKVLEVGEHSDIVQTGMGWSIIKRVPLDAEKHTDYSELIIYKLTDNNLSSEIAALMETAEVEYTDAYGDPSYENLMSYIEIDVPAAE